MRKEFENLKGYSDAYRSDIEELTGKYDLDGRQDYLYTDDVKAQRVQARNADFNRRIDQAAEYARIGAKKEIEKLRGELQRYVISCDDADTVRILQTLLNAGVELTDLEIDAFAAKGGYFTLRLLEKPSGGRVHAPDLDSCESSLQELEAYFNGIQRYRGSMSSFAPSNGSRVGPSVFNVVAAAEVDGFAKNLERIDAQFQELEAV